MLDQIPYKSNKPDCKQNFQKDSGLILCCIDVKTVEVPPRVHHSLEQEDGILRSRMREFSRWRQKTSQTASRERDRLRSRLDKLLNTYKKATKIQLTLGRTSLEQAAIVGWDKAEGGWCCCAVCLSAINKSHNCRLCGRLICDNCARYIPLGDIDRSVAGDSNFDFDVLICNGSCFGVAIDTPSPDLVACGKLVKVYSEFATVRRALDANNDTTQVQAQLRALDNLSKDIMRMKFKQKSNQMLQAAIRQGAVAIVQSYFKQRTK